MNYLIFKSLHIISVITWFAGLFYMPRLFVYFAEAETKSLQEKNILQAQFKIMQRRLWFGITIPSSIAVLLFGFYLLVNQFLPLSNHPWLIVKLLFVVGLYGYQFFLHRIFKKQRDNLSSFTPMSLRIINEISTLFLFAIVFLVIFKNVLSTLYGIIALMALIGFLLLAIYIYKNIRNRSKDT